ncbi:MAG: helicase RepA family protein [Desulfovibrionaceae bacterium]|nr:helicase RepA family protein [Desulfovibrionaceae bacterium]
MSAVHPLKTELEALAASVPPLEQHAVLQDATPEIRFRVYRSDILDLPDPEDRIEDLLPAQGTVILYGPSMSAKTFIALDMCFSIAMGTKWFDWKTYPCEILYVNLEGGHSIKKRIKAWMQETGEGYPDAVGFTLDRFNLLKEEDVNAIIEISPKGGMVVIDTMNRATPGADENSSTDMSLIIEAADKIYRAIGGLVVIITHTGKDITKGPRGHSSLIPAVDAAIEVRRQEKTNSRSILFKKVKDGEDGIIRNFQLKKVVVGYRPDGREISSCVVEYLEQDATRKDQEKPKQMIRSVQYALDSFHKARGDSDSVHLEEWRPVYYAKSTSPTDKAKEVAFGRGRDKLVESNIISVHNNVYTFNKPDTFDFNPNTPEQEQNGTKTEQSYSLF